MQLYLLIQLLHDHSDLIVYDDAKSTKILSGAQTAVHHNSQF